MISCSTLLFCLGWPPTSCFTMAPGRTWWVLFTESYSSQLTSSWWSCWCWWWWWRSPGDRPPAPVGQQAGLLVEDRGGGLDQVWTSPLSSSGQNSNRDGLNFFRNFFLSTFYPTRTKQGLDSLYRRLVTLLVLRFWLSCLDPCPV